jgi:TonB-linked SusC/RagA family outer membrane protein
MMFAASPVYSTNVKYITMQFMEKPLHVHAPFFFFIMKAAIIPVIAILAGSGVVLATESRGQEVLEKKISLEVRNQEMLILLTKIEEAANIRFIYSPQVIPVHNRVSLKANNDTLGEVLRRLLAPYDILFEAIDNQIVLRKREKSPADPADRIITGQVTDETNSPLPGVSVLIKDAGIGTATDVDGRYSLNIPTPHEKGVLVISFIGYTTQEIGIGDRTSIDVQLIPEVHELEQVVVVGYGLQRSKDITGAVETVSMEDLPEAPVAQIGQMLQGRMAGVRINQVSGRPGEGLKIQVRGAVSLTAGADPLFVVDGMPISGDISFINPNEIESITVLKDPAAASLYGSRSSNGVVLVQTKKGSPGQTRVDFNAYYGFEKVPASRRLEMMDAGEYAQFQKEIAEFNGRPVDPAFQNPGSLGKGTDWFEAITRTGAIQSYNVAVSTGSDKFNTSASAGYFNQEGVIVGTGFERFSVRINSRYQATKKLNIGFNVAPTYTFNTNFNTDGLPYGTENIVSAALLTTPLANPYNPDGSLALTASDPATFGNPNWLRVAKEKVFENKNLQLLSNMFAEYEIIDGLKAKTTANIQYGNRNIFQFNPSTIGTLFSPPPRIPSGSDNNGRFYNWLNENTLNYQKTFGEHELDVLGGFTAQRFRGDNTLVTATNYADDKVQTVGAAGQTPVTSDVQEWSLLSLLARVNYQYMGKYLLTASFRRDGSSRFGPNNRWGNFPSISAGWIPSEEDFWNIEPISFLKLRASYGVTGNFEIGNYTYTPTLRNVFYPFGSDQVSGRAPVNLGDQNLGWENNKQFNIGADINLFNDRIQLAYNYYTRNVTDLLYNVDVPVSSGYSNIQTNIGELKFSGHEIAVNATVVRNNNLRWNADLNVSFDRNKTIALSSESGVLFSGQPLYGFYSHITQAGQPIAMFYGAVHDGVYVNQADFDSSPKHPSSQVGTIKFRDLDGDGEISFPEDMRIIGSPWPDFTFGINNNLLYKTFNLSFSIAGSYGNKVLAYHENWTTNLDGVFNVLEEVKYRWKSEEEPGRGKYGSVQQGTTFLERDRWSNRFLQDASFLSFKNITLGYTLPLKDKVAIRNAQIYASMQNAFILTSYEGPNPEVNTRTTSSGITPGFDENSYPLPRTISVGVNLSF